MKTYSYIEKIIITENHTFLVSHEIKIEKPINNVVFHVGVDTHKHDDVTIIMPNCCKYFLVKIGNNAMLVDIFDPTKE